VTSRGGETPWWTNTALRGPTTRTAGVGQHAAFVDRARRRACRVTEPDQLDRDQTIRAGVSGVTAAGTLAGAVGIWPCRLTAEPEGSGR
jgi:hypothetical protein